MEITLPAQKALPFGPGKTCRWCLAWNRLASYAGTKGSSAFTFFDFYPRWEKGSKLTSEAKMRDNLVRYAARFAIVTAMALACPILGSSAPPTNVILPKVKLTTSPAVDLGRSIASSANGSVVVVGSPDATVGKVANAGAAYVWVQSGGNKVWGTRVSAPVELVYSSSPAPFTNFGASVAISSNGSRVVVGEPAGNSAHGEVWVFNEPTGGWASAGGKTLTPAAGLTAGDAVDAKFGASVAISGNGNTIVGGAPLQMVNSYLYAGTGYVFTHSASSIAWSQGHNLCQPSSGSCASTQNQQAGTSVGISSNGTWIFLGAPYGDAQNQGTVLPFHNDPKSGWVPSAAINSPGLGTPADDGVDFGQSLAVGGSATPTLVVGGPGHNKDTGIVYVYEYNRGWTRKASLLSPTPVSGSRFGQSVALSSDGTKLVVGSYPVMISSGGFARNPGKYTPAAMYQYDRPLIGAWTSNQSPSAIFQDATSQQLFEDYLGGNAAVGISGGYTWVFGGAPSSSAAYIFEGK